VIHTWSKCNTGFWRRQWKRRSQNWSKFSCLGWTSHIWKYAAFVCL